MDDLMSFLLARLDEDEKTAIAVFRANAAHIARWDPARALTEVKAKRHIIEWCSGAMEAGEIKPGTSWNDDAAGAVLGEHILRIMALVYSNHPDYQYEWVPGELLAADSEETTNLVAQVHVAVISSSRLALV